MRAAEGPPAPRQWGGGEVRGARQLSSCGMQHVLREDRPVCGTSARPTVAYIVALKRTHAKHRGARAGRQAHTDTPSNARAHARTPTHPPAAPGAPARSRGSPSAAPQPVVAQQAKPTALRKFAFHGQSAVWSGARAQRASPYRAARQRTVLCIRQRGNRPAAGERAPYASLRALMRLAHGQQQGPGTAGGLAAPRYSYACCQCLDTPQHMMTTTSPPPLARGGARSDPTSNLLIGRSCRSSIQGRLPCPALPGPPAGPGSA